MKLFLKSRRTYLAALVFILLVASFFRVYQLKERMSYAHDADLYGWIVKDVVVNHHFRLIGQLTSAEGIFIGPAFYYALIPFFVLGRMDPFGAAILTTIVGMISVLSYYLVFSKLFRQEVGLIAAFLQSFLIDLVYFDRRVVPSSPTNVWVIWYLFVVVKISRGDYSVLPFLGILIAAIWHIHVALLPALAAIPVAILVSRRWPTVRQVSIFLVILVISSLPLLVFETRHNFVQTRSLISDFGTNHGGGLGLAKLDHVLNMVTGNVSGLLTGVRDAPVVSGRLFLAVFLALGLWLVKKNYLQSKELWPLYAWVVGVFGFFVLSSSFISEYYFYSIEVVLILILSFFLFHLYQARNFGKQAVFAILFFGLGYHLSLFLPQTFRSEYANKKAAVAFIATDAKLRGLPCVSVSYITLPGENVGFRYFFWLLGLHVNQPKSGSPAYTIVYPENLANGRNQVEFGRWRVIPPERGMFVNQLQESCSGENSNLTDPMFGYVY